MSARAKLLEQRQATTDQTANCKSLAGAARDEAGDSVGHAFDEKIRVPRSRLCRRPTIEVLSIGAIATNECQAKGATPNSQPCNHIPNTTNATSPMAAAIKSLRVRTTAGAGSPRGMTAIRSRIA